MKKLITSNWIKLTIILVLFCSICVAFNSAIEKEFNIKLTSGQVNLLGQTLANAKIAINRSDIPINQATVVLKNIDSLEKIMGAQVQLQLKDTVKKDTVKKIVNKKKKS